MLTFEEEPGSFFFLLILPGPKVQEICSSSQLFLRQWFSMGLCVLGCVFACSETFGNSWRHFFGHNRGERLCGFWHLVGGGQICYWMSCNTQATPYKKKCPALLSSVPKSESPVLQKQRCKTKRSKDSKYRRLQFLEIQKSLFTGFESLWGSERSSVRLF